MDDDLPTEYDVIVVGTGLVESVVAAASSRIGKKVLHLDANSYYGDLWATFSLENFEQWLNATNGDKKTANEDESAEKEYSCYNTFGKEHSISSLRWEWFVPEENEKEASFNENEFIAKNDRAWTREELKKFSQKFNIDISPKIIFSKGPMVELLIRSGVSRYTEFVNVHNVLLFINSVIESVPYSKSDVFSTRSVSVVEKRILMRLLQEIQNFSHESTGHDNQYDCATFQEFLRKFQIPDNIEKYILFSIARVSKESSCKDGIKAAQIFLNSLGVYGNSPFLWPLYGSSELVQAFCRLCAVYGGIYCLNRGVSQVLVDSGECKGIISDGKKLFAQNVVMSSARAPAEFTLKNKTETILRGILITNRTLYSSGRRGASLLHFPSEDPSLAPVTVIELDSSTLASPNGLFLVHLSKTGPEGDYREFDRVVQELFNPCEKKENIVIQENEKEGSSNDKPSVLFQSYFSITQVQEEPSDIKPKNFYSCTGPVQFELDFFSALKAAENIFRQMFPGEEFLPAPLESTVEE